VNEIIQANKVADPNAITRLNDIWQKMNSISLRHVAWLEPIPKQPVFKNWYLEVTVNKEIYDRMNKTSAIETSVKTLVISSTPS
jgi:hypothetical protein